VNHQVAAPTATATTRSTVTTRIMRREPAALGVGAGDDARYKVVNAVSSRALETITGCARQDLNPRSADEKFQRYASMSCGLTPHSPGDPALLRLSMMDGACCS
jgi:hypothetical protein